MGGNFGHEARESLVSKLHYPITGLGFPLPSTSSVAAFVRRRPTPALPATQVQLCRPRKRSRACIPSIDLDKRSRLLRFRDTQGEPQQTTARPSHRTAAKPPDPQGRRPSETHLLTTDATTTDAVSTDCLGLDAGRRQHWRQTASAHPASDLLPAQDEFSQGH